MHKEIKILFGIFCFALVMKLAFPMNDWLYDDSHKDGQGVFYLSKFDSYFYLNNINEGKMGNTISFIGYVLRYIFKDNKGLYWLPALFGIVNTLLIYLIARKLYPPLSSMVASIFYLLYHYSFFSAFKGYYDTNFMIAFLVLLSIYFLIEKKWVWVSIPTVLLIFTWDGWWVIIGFGIVCWAFNMVFYRRQLWSISVPVIASMILANKVMDTFITYKNYGIISELTTYQLLLVDIILIPLSLFALYHVLLFTRNWGKGKVLEYKHIIVILGFIIFFVLSIAMVRFVYLFAIFYALLLGYGVSMIVPKFKDLIILPLFILFILVAWSGNYNRQTIIMEDVMVDSVNGLNGCIEASWDIGYMLQAYTSAQVLQHGSPTNFQKYATSLMLPENMLLLNKGCHIILSSRDINRLAIYELASGIPLTDKSFVNQKNYNCYKSTKMVGSILTIYKLENIC